MFETFFQLGFCHLTVAGAWDHQLFLLTIALAYQPTLWRKWIWLATVFAVGHSTALALASVGAVSTALSWIEPAIAGSIVALAVVDLAFLAYDPYQLRAARLRLSVTVGLVFAFGIVHGLGFAGGFLAVLAGDAAAGELVGMLLAFTLGVEAGQLLILFALWLVLYVVLEMIQLRPLLLRRLALVAVAIAGLALLLGR